MKPVPGASPWRSVERIAWAILSLVLLPRLTVAVNRPENPGLFFPAGRGVFRLGLQVRTRTELWHDYTVRGPAAGVDDHALLLRTRITGEYRHPRGLRLVLELQDSRYTGSLLTPGDFPRTCPFQDEFALHRAFAEFRLSPKGPFALKAGRQTITYADHMVFGPGNWGNVGRYWWDALKLSIRTGKVQTDLLWGQRVIREPGRPDTGHDPFHLLGAYSMIPRPWGQIHLFLLERRYSRLEAGEAGMGRTRVRSAGAWAHVQLARRWAFEGTLAFQGGERKGDEVRAWGGHFRLRGGFPGRLKPYLGAGLAVGSGDRDPHDGVAGTFDGLFGSVSGAYGRMNLFCWKNLRDIFFSAGFEPTSRVSVWFDLHHFELDSPADAWYWCSAQPILRDPAGLHGRQLGQELDLLMRIRLPHGWRVFAGAGFFRRGAYLAQDPRVARHLAWGFVQLNWSI